MDQNYMYSILTNDRSGARILDMLFCYAYSIKHNINYKGACDRPSKYNNAYLYKIKIKDCVVLCEFLGLPEPNIVDYEVFNDKTHIFNNYMCYDYARKNYDDIFTSKFRTVIYNECKNNLIPLEKTNENDYIVAVHIRRGDVQENNRWGFRYTDNKYYLELIKHLKKKFEKTNKILKIYIFSESSTDKPFTKFEQLGCIMKLDTSLTEAWSHFIQSDLFIMASSGFSIVPALYRQNDNVIYTWNKYFSPLDKWQSGSLEDKINFIKTMQ